MSLNFNLRVPVNNFQTIFELPLYTIDSVSYTHLDVYKRQVYGVLTECKGYLCEP